MNYIKKDTMRYILVNNLKQVIIQVMIGRHITHI
jgi:hypothetical protein